ncbi:MAG: efflux RND transporter periplasmic adaptor subunit [Vulcanimicrobiaceae bacterium]
MKVHLRPALLAMLFACGACADNQTPLSTATVGRQSLSQNVTATGTLNAQDTVLVGSQVSGTIQNIFVDYNSRVHRGQILAQLDPSPFQAGLDQATSSLAQMRAQQVAATASASGMQYSSAAARQTAQSQFAQIAAADEDVRKATSALHLARLTQSRNRALFRDGYVARSVVDSDESNVAAAKAALAAAQTEARSARSNSRASVFQARSSAAQATGAAASGEASAAAQRAAQAAVRQAQLNLEHATIVSPVDGTVVARNVSIGQTVAAAFQSPTLFTIAKDLRKMELDIAVGEPDVGSIKDGQEVDFSVLAYPGRTFSATVAQIRQNPTVVNNVTTYTTVAYVRNDNGWLRPGMTANARIVIMTYHDALVVPLAALQWRPAGPILKAYRIESPPQEQRGIQVRSIWGQTGNTADTAVAVGGTGRLYVPHGRTLQGVLVRVLAVEGSLVAVQPVTGTLHRGDTVVTESAS